MNKFLSVLVWLCFVSIVSAQNASSKAMNKPIPNAKIKDANGKPVELASYTHTGKITVVSFWATWCGPCKKELDAYKSHYADWAKKYGTQFLAISIDDFRNQAKINPLVAQKGWPYTILMDGNSDLQRQLGFNAIPQLYLLDKKGNIVYQSNGYSDGAEKELEDKMAALK